MTSPLSALPDGFSTISLQEKTIFVGVTNLIYILFLYILPDLLFLSILPDLVFLSILPDLVFLSILPDLVFLSILPGLWFDTNSTRRSVRTPNFWHLISSYRGGAVYMSLVYLLKKYSLTIKNF